MGLANGLTTERFRSRCATCPERNLGSCLLAQAVLGADYSPGNCKGPRLQPRPGFSAFFDDEHMQLGSLIGSRLVCQQELDVITGEVVGEVTETPLPELPPPEQ